MGEFIDGNGILHVDMESHRAPVPSRNGWVPFSMNTSAGDPPKATMLYLRSSEYQSAEDFFYANAGSSYDPASETEDQGRRRSARELVRAEKWAQTNGYTFTWIDDPEASRDSGHPEYACIMYCRHGGPAQSLWAIAFEDFGPPCDPYRRVVQAELALEEMP